ncbi:helix-turn-helix domain-containing protein [Prevotella sp. 10(H)]|uniref:AraC family transcriptional regulator n=1 Tax=Prevotella sp. 10(H) TaxID=1158294 RepID=UPI0004A73BBB|nr:helix-turn-helix domain-containing protein [Prevotella sp. 10(H)]
MEIFNIIQPAPVLAPYIKHYWTLEIDSIISVSERIVPVGCMQIVFHRGDRMNSLTDRKLQPQSFICGQSDGFTDLISTGKVNMLVIVFHPHGAKAFFPMPMSEFHKMDIPTGEIGDIALRELEERIYEEPDNTKAIALIESYFIFQLRKTFDSYNHKRIHEVLKAINREHQPNITSLSEIACLSYKQFNRVFTEYIGANPKEFTRIVRFQRALYMLQQNPEINITELAFDCGYYDQPHLIKEFKSFSGHTPYEYMAVCSPYSDYFS